MRTNPADRAAFLENSTELDHIYGKASSTGSSQAPPAELESDHHYICFVRRSNSLWELDGDRSGPKY